MEELSELRWLENQKNQKDLSLTINVAIAKNMDTGRIVVLNTKRNQAEMATREDTYQDRAHQALLKVTEESKSFKNLEEREEVEDHLHLIVAATHLHHPLRLPHLIHQEGTNFIT